MNPSAILDEARYHGVELSVTPGGKLRWRCQGALPDSLRDAIAAQRSGLLGLFEAIGAVESAAGPFLAALRSELADVERRDFGGTFPQTLRNILADCLAVLDSYASDPAAVAARGKDPLAEIREGRPWVLAVVERARQRVGAG